MRRRRDRIGPLRDHARTRNVADDLRAGQMAADAGLRTLPHLYLYRRAGFEIILVDAETAGRDLYDRVCAVLVEILMQAALAGVVQYAELGRRARERGVSVVADRAVAHRREHHRHRKLYLR